eukprot:GFUD01033762.1.p1 GENE.GFUD01033762.1~~GFUD01033762.1.p1  ORF type:complete len:491 (-),score=154.57 GFUD01033762.1:268-1740(-)
MDGEEVLESSDVYREIYEVVEKIGEGGFGKVFSVLNKETKETFAAKCIKTRSRRDKSKPKEEIRLLKSLHNDFIIKFVDAFEGPTEIIVVTEYLAGGELFERIVDDQFELLESDCCFFMRQVCRGLDYLHRNSIVHLDIKPENIVLRGKEGRNIKIIDFGTALKLVPGKKVQNMVGTPEFMAPEVVNYEDIALETDQWSVGVLSYILLSGYSPFLDDSDDQKTMSNVTMAKYDFDYEEFEEVSPDAKDFITRLLRKSPARRLTASACLDHSWLKEKLMRKKTTRIKVTNLRKFLTRRKVQNIGRALRVINVFKGAAKDSRSSSEGLLDSDRTMTSETVDLEAMMKEDTRSSSEGLLDSEERDIENLDRTMTSETVDLEAMMKEDTSDEEEEGLAKEGIPENEEQSQDDLQVKRVNFDSLENTISSYSKETVDDTSDEDDFISTFHESEDTFDEVIREKKPEPIKTLGLRRTKSRAAPGTVKKLMARFQNP